MTQEIFNSYSIILQSLTAVGAAIFAIWQILINLRLKKLQDYVAVTIVPQPPGDLRLQIINVGKINLYLQKYEIGTVMEAFAKPMLIPAGSNSFLFILIKNFVLTVKMPIKLYLIDELDEKYLSTGEVLVEEITITRSLPPTQTSLSPTISPTMQIETIKMLQASAWAYKTIKTKWEI